MPTNAGAEKAKKIRSCFSCRNYKALAKDTNPCYHCWGGSLWKKPTARQNLLAEREEKLLAHRKSKKKETFSQSEVHTDSEVYEAVVNKS